jgi:hypothetical protein
MRQADTKKEVAVKPTASLLLRIDAAVNLLLGLLLLAFSRPLAQALGVPYATEGFYPTILGAVLFGIGIALAMEARRPPEGLPGLGLGGAVAINLSAGFVLLGWLVLGGLQLPLRGLVLLWSLAVLLVGLSTCELIAHFRK